MGSYGVGAAVVPSLITSVNGHAVGSSALNDSGFHDLERIEVLKGPQGTLSGRNAVQGLVNLVTARPTGELEGSIEVTMGNYNSERTNLVFNVPLSEKVSMRLATSVFNRDGTIRKINTEVDKIISKKNLLKKLDYSSKLVGQVKLEYQLPKNFDKKN